MSKFKTPISYYGGKQTMVSKILPLIPNHKLYGAVFWSKPKSEMECINDLNGHVVTFYRVLKEDFALLRNLIKSTPASRRIHRETEYILKNSEYFSDVRVAWAFWVQTNMSFSSTIFGGYGYGRGDSCVKKIDNKRLQFTKALTQRLDRTDIECNDALKVIQSRDSADTFVYADPPYHNAHMGHYGGYTELEFKQLLSTLSNMKGKFLLSSYPSEPLTEYTRQMGWQQQEHSKAIVACKGDRSKMRRC
ncbi:MAG: DNA adenine methylase [Candidatus Kapaibacterium sp.]|nr:MAG: DNA adenine methylase [Candidatus Kapabacteria bacterium]